MKRNLLKLSIYIASLLPASALAQQNPPNTGSGSSSGSGTGLSASSIGIPTQFASFENIVKTIFNISIIISGIAFVVLLLFGGVQYLTSAGGDEGVKNAKNTMINASIGLAIVISAFAIGTWILSLLGLGTSGTLKIK